ncbi:leucine-rich repeat receptor-like protein kinase TDR [Tanacetum coccineum]
MVLGLIKDDVLSMASNAGVWQVISHFNYHVLTHWYQMKSIAKLEGRLLIGFHMRLSSWKANLLSIGGRLTLIKSVLGSLGIYYLSIFRAPESVLQDLERIRAKFFWGGNKDENKMAWVKWPIILNSFDKGGLNIGSLKAFNLALLQKWRWRLLSSPNALWVQVIKAYHGQEDTYEVIVGIDWPMYPLSITRNAMVRACFWFFLKLASSSLGWRTRTQGSFPFGVSKLVNLAVLDAFSNSFSGSLPVDVCDIASLKVFNFAGSYFSGPIPGSFAKLPNLESLLIWDNFFSGMLPQELGKHSKLKWVDVSTNDFVGVIPPDICSGGELSRLMLFSNYFSGGLSSISNCSSLVRIRLEDNLFSGDISLDFNVLKDVSYVDLSGNNLTGGIPSDIIRASSLERFSVSNNPNLGGIIPEKVWSLPALHNFSASSCSISGNFPGFQSCKSLAVVDLNGNHLSGTIPESVSFCENLETLNLAENNFSGEIPVKLGTSMKLKFLNLSYNDLSGVIPTESTFKSMDSSSFIGNPNLCGAPLTTPCNHGNGISKGIDLGSRRKHKVAWVLVLCAIVVVLSGLLFAIFNYRIQNSKSPLKLVSFGGYQNTQQLIFKRGCLH